MRNEDFVSHRRIARSLCIILAVVFIAAATTPSLAVRQRTRRVRRPAVATPQQHAYDRAYGLYSLVGTLSPEFGSLSELELVLQPRTSTPNSAGLGSGIEGVLTVDEMLASPKRTTTRGADGRPFTLIQDRENREYRMIELTVFADALAFTTAEVEGVSYKFEGKFTIMRPTRRRSDQSVLRGRLTKLERGREVAAADLRFTVDRSD